MQEAKLPSFIPPMMAKIAEAPFDSPDWIFEVKLDGYRGIAVFDAAGQPHLWSRNGLPLEKKFPAVAKALSNLKLHSTKSPAFRNNRQHRSLYYVFDVLWHDGDDLTGKLIMERRQILERVIKPTGGIQIGTYIEGEGMALFDLTKQ